MYTIPVDMLYSGLAEIRIPELDSILQRATVWAPHAFPGGFGVSD